MMKKKMKFAVNLLFCVYCLLAIGTASASVAPESADRAVVIAKAARNKIENSAKSVKATTSALFKEFATRSIELQIIIDIRQQLEAAGYLDKNDPDGQSRRAHINARLIGEVAKMKKVADEHLTDLLQSLDDFDEAISQSLESTQSTRSLNSNYSLALEHYLIGERKHFDSAASEAKDTLEALRDVRDANEKHRLRAKYKRAKQRLHKIDIRRKLYEARLNVSNVNQQVSDSIRDQIKNQGSELPSRMRGLMTNWYTTFAQIAPIAELGGTSSPELFSNLGFGSLQELSDNMNVVEGALGKLSGVLDDMVTDVLAGLGNIQVVGQDGLSSGSTMMSIDEELEHINAMRTKWNKNS